MWLLGEPAKDTLCGTEALSRARKKLPPTAIASATSNSSSARPNSIQATVEPKWLTGSRSDHRAETPTHPTLFTPFTFHLVIVRPFALRLLTGTAAGSKSSSRTRAPPRPSREMCSFCGIAFSVGLTSR